MTRRILLLACLLAPSLALAQVGEPPRPAARPGRLSFGLGGGIATASMDDSIAGWVNGQLPDEMDLPASEYAWFASASLRAYLPLHILLEVGYDTLYSPASKDYQIPVGIGYVGASVESHTLLMEVPVLAGAHFSLGKNVYVHVAGGVAFTFFGRSWWDGTNADIPDYSADGKMGYHVAGAFTWLVGEDLALELEARYRLVRAEPTRQLANDLIIYQPGTTNNYAIDFSGIGAALNLRAFF